MQQLAFVETEQQLLSIKGPGFSFTPAVEGFRVQYAHAHLIFVIDIWN